MNDFMGEILGAILPLSFLLILGAGKLLFQLGSHSPYDHYHK
jgi:hypothetical protein